MSQLDSGMDFNGAMESPYAPLRRALIRPPASPQQPLYNPAMQMQNAQAMATARRPGRTPMPQSGPGGASPMATHVAQAKMLAMTDLPDEDKEKFMDAAKDQNIPFDQFQKALAAHVQNSRLAAKAAPAQHNFGGQQPTDPNSGTISIMAGQGPRGMSQQQLMDWGDRARQQLGAGEKIRQSGTGFEVSGAGSPQQQQADPIVQMHDALKQAGADENSLNQWKAFAQAGATPEQLHMAAQQIMQQQAAGKKQEAAGQEKEQARQEHTTEHHNDMMIHQLQHQQTLASQMGNQEQVDAVQKQIDGLIKPQQQAGQQAQQQGQPVQIGSPADAAKLPSGTQFTFNGHIYKKH